MKIIDRHIGVTVISGSLLALLVLVSLAGFFSFLGQLVDIKGNFGVLDAILFVLLTLPRWAYELFPTAVLLGSLLSLGGLAVHSELVVMRAAGLSVQRIAWAIVKSGLLLLLISVLLGEVVAPPAEEYGQKLQSTAKTGYVTLKTGDEFWARDGSSIVNIRAVLPGERLESISIFDYDEQRKLKTALHAQSAQFQDGKWMLNNIRKSWISEQGVRSENLENEYWDSLLNPGLLSVLAVKPKNLAVWSLLKYIHYLKDNNLNAERYELAFWVKLVTPISSIVMLLVAVPFVFGPLRSAGAGHRILVGVLVGVGFHLINQALNQMGIVYGMNPVISATLPSILVASAAIYAMKRIN